MTDAMRRKRRWWPWLGLVALLALAGGAYAYTRVQPLASIGSSYIAKQHCSCVFVAGRSEASCRTEFEPDVGYFTVKTDRAARRVDASLLWWRGAATHEPAYGCTVAR